ncbi:hypothetical protein E2C01_096129 [Portunus trituberculatus]|uniref:Uncharacterized protein n=1 Tax=Portunus trituberculatus TaxID=210409 RepID=A0A5B7JX69_PORTR|nr:hypothetical protein [Portunus trituberculatus]
MGCGSKGSKGERDEGVHHRGRTSVVTRCKQRKEHKPQQPSPASACATPHSVFTCTPYHRTTPDTIEHFLLHCPRFHSHHTALRSRLSALAIITLHLPTVLAASGVHPSWQPAVLHLTCAFLRKTGQLSHL